MCVYIGGTSPLKNNPFGIYVDVPQKAASPGDSPGDSKTRAQFQSLFSCIEAL